MTASRIVCIALAGVVGGFVPAQAALLGVTPGLPTLVFNNQGVTTYDSVTDLFAVDASPVAIRFTPFGLPVLVLPTGNPATEAVTIRIHVDQSGAFTGGVAEADLVVIGQVDQNGDSIPEFSGVLLTGEAAAFGFREKSGSTGIFDFRFAVTGGAMASEFGGGAIGVALASENSEFPGGFTRSFSGGAKGNIGPIAFRCGDNFVDPGEQCDDGAGNSDTEPNACRTDCTLPACGDGVIDAGEQCDDGTNNSDTEPNACRTDCTRATCGDGVVDAGEQCDDGNTDDNDVCSNNCTAGCGNGIVNTGEACDDGAGNSDTEPNACRTNCTRATCGDGVVDAGEQCDDGNTDDNDACSNNCTAGCGNGIVNTGEACDDGAGNSDTEPNACRTDCTLPACGDGVVDAGEQCDDGTNNSDTVPNACRTDCTNPACGDGVVDAGEQCDDGSNNTDTVPNACRTDCTRSAHNEGCTPGYWKNHASVWDGVGADDKTATIKTSNLFNAKFGVTGSQSGVANCMTLLAALNLPKTTSSCLSVGARNNERLALDRHAAAALASADSGINYPYTVAQVIALYRDAVGADAGPETISSAHEKLSDANELGCPF